ncbi:MAG: translation initiation factor IF-2 [Bacteroidales bacterium]|nr:translation initiation factor IF-2 [Bacteroidales bacterium]
MTRRLSKVARELNVGISTIVDFLHKKGFDLDSNPNTKVSDELYFLLTNEYSTDTKVKKESEKIQINKLKESKGSVTLNDIETTKTEDSSIETEEEIIIKDPSGVGSHIDNRLKKQEKATVKVVGKIDLDSITKKKVKEEEKEEEPEPKEEPKVEKEPEETTKKEEPEKVIEEVTRIEPEKEIEVRVVGKIDLESMNQKTRPARKTKKEKEKERIEKQQKKEFEKAAKTTKQEVKEKVIDADEEPEEEKVIKANVGQLAGPTVVGKIDLPAQKDKDKKPIASSRDDDFGKKKKRKRIFKDEKGGEIEDEELVKGKKGKKKKTYRPDISEEDVQKQIKDTLARLTSKGKSKGSKYRREKRDAISQKLQEEIEQKEKTKNIIKVTEFVSVNELASMMSVPVNEIISSCMSLGLFVSINQRLDAETMALVADEFGYKVEFVSVELQESIAQEADNEEDLVPRPPIVTVMGHVDHGKTKLLDHVRNTNVIAGEAGGITQHIGAYNVMLEDGRKITFLDTPGHEAFTAMRARGAQVTDVAIIVVAADDGVKPQTVEAINHAHAAGVPIVFAINKIDKPSANPEKVKEELANMNFLVEDWGGKYQSQEISAKNGIKVDDLLEKVLLEAEMLDLKANPNRKASGTIIESSLDKGRGYVATILVQNGTLRIGDLVLAGTHFGHVKAMYNERGNRITEADPSTPALILGLNGAPQAGDTFNVMESDREAKEIASKREQLQREQGLRTQKHITLDEIGRRIAIGNFQELNIIVKGDVDGSVEALSDSLIKLSTPEIEVVIRHKAVGQISESDILLAAASDAIIIGFQVRPSMNARKLAEKEEIDVRLYSIIYDAIEDVKAAMEGMLSPEIKEEVVATLEILETFKITKVGTIAGCMVKEGKINRDSKVRLIREGIVLYTGELGSLKRFKDDVKEVVTGLECGLNISNYNDIKVGDIIEAFKETEIKKKL